MATGDFAYLRLAVCEMLSVPTFTDLSTNLQQEVDALINEAYRSCFLRPDGKRARWGQQNISFLLKAPAAFTFIATQGANSMGSVSGATLEAAYAGSKIKVGSKFYTYAGKDGSSNDVLSEPWSDATGSQTATFYFSSFVLPVESIELCEEPEVLGWGRLSPMSSPGQEIRNRQWATGDRVPERGPVWINPQVFGDGYEAGDPQFYLIDDSNLAAAGSFSTVRMRFVVYPLPDTSGRTIRCRANILPALLSSGTDVPYLKASAIIDTLLPILRMKIAQSIRRFNGTNKTELIRAGQEAMARLGALDASQKHRPSRVKTKPGW